MSLGKSELKKCIKVNVGFFSKNIKGSIRVQYYDVVEGICQRNMDFLKLIFTEFLKIRTCISVADL